MIYRRSSNLPPLVSAAHDPNTFSNYLEFNTRSITVNLEIDFDQKVLKGDVELLIQSLNDGSSREVHLDSSHVDLSSLEINGRKVQWEVHDRVEPFGSKVVVHLDRGYTVRQEMRLQVSRSY